MWETEKLNETKALTRIKSDTRRDKGGLFLLRELTCLRQGNILDLSDFIRMLIRFFRVNILFELNGNDPGNAV